MKPAVIVTSLLLLSACNDAPKQRPYSYEGKELQSDTEMTKEDLIKQRDLERDLAASKQETIDSLEKELDKRVQALDECQAETLKLKPH